MVRQCKNKLYGMSESAKIWAVAPSVSMDGKKSTGIHPSNLWRWTRPAEMAALRERCRDDPSALDDKGKHKGDRGKKKAGQGYTARIEYSCHFPELEDILTSRLQHNIDNRVRTTTSDVLAWMCALVADAREAELADGIDDQRKANWKNSRRWFHAYLKRSGFTVRRATNNRAHSAEDLIGDVVGFLLALRKLRKENPSDEDLVWGNYGLYHTSNCDSVPIPFCNNSKLTIAKEGAKRVLFD
jgi:hypothetical protein